MVPGTGGGSTTPERPSPVTDVWETSLPAPAAGDAVTRQRRYVLGGLLAVLALLAGALLADVLATVFFAITVAYLLFPLREELTRRGLSLWRASFLTTLLAALAVLVLAFGGLALAGYRRFDLYGGAGTGQTSDSDSLRGRTGRVTERVTEESGEVKLDRGGFNPNYSARALDGEIPVGAEVLVVDPGGGNVLTVASLDEMEDDIDAELARERAATAAEASDGQPTGEEESERA